MNLELLVLKLEDDINFLQGFNKRILTIVGLYKYGICSQKLNRSLLNQNLLSVAEH